jgi:hypothetical protein
VQRSQKERILDKEIDNSLDGSKAWGQTHRLTLQHAYGRAPFFGTYAASLARLFEARWERLVDVNAASLELLRDAFGIRTRLARSSELAVEGAKADLILNICKATGADTLLAGLGGSRGYLDVEAFARAGVRIAWHEFKHPTYAQVGAQPFAPGLSAIDMLLNCGPASRQLLLGEQVEQGAPIPEVALAA